MDNLFKGFNRIVVINHDTPINTYLPCFTVPLIFSTDINRPPTLKLSDLRLNIDINSLIEFVFTPDIADSDAQQRRAYEIAANSAGKFLLTYAIKLSDSDNPVDLGYIPLFNRLPYYSIDIIDRLATNGLALFQSGSSLLFKINAQLGTDDRVTILAGGSLETWNSPLVIQAGSGSSSLPNNLVTDSSGNPIVIGSDYVVFTP